MAQIGTIKLQTQNGVKELPVYDTADAGSDVYDMVRVQTSSGIGFIPFASTSEASYPELRIQTQNQGILAAHNRASLLNYVMLDDFEDGNVNGWNWNSDYGDFYTDSTRTSDGSNSAKLECNPGVGINAYRNYSDTYEGAISVRVYCNNSTDYSGNSWDVVLDTVNDSAAVTFHDVSMDIELGFSEPISKTWETYTWYEIEVHQDASNGLYHYYINGSKVGTSDYTGDGSGWNGAKLQVDCNDGGNRMTHIDKIRTIENKHA